MTPDYHKLFESSPGLYLVMTPDLRIVAVSDAYLRATMTRRQEIVNRSVFEVFPEHLDKSDPAGLQTLRASLQLVLRDRLANSMPPQKSRDIWPASQGGGFEEGYWTPTNFPVLGERGELRYIIHRVEDVSEFVRFKQQDAEQGRRNEELRVRAEKVEAEIVIRAKEVQQLNRFFEISSDLLCIANMKGCFLRVNPAFAAALGYTAKELVETPFLNFVHSDDTAATLVEMEKLSSGTPTVQFENRYRCKDGSWKWLSWKTQPSLEEGLLYVTARDITESKRAAGRLAKSGAASDAANLAKSQFLANMSHEIRTPLTAILGYTDLMSDPEQTPGDRLDCVEIIRHSGDHLLTIINDILDISKIEAGEMQLERISCSPCQILNDIASTMRARAKEKGLKFEVSSTGPIPETIHSDPTRLRQIIFNLVGNAIKFTESGWVRVAMKLEGADSASPRLRFEVTDSGIGIGAENLNHLFRPFSQADSSTTRRFGGSGLGLFISRRLAQMLGGDISVDTQIGRGSLFSVGVETGPLSGVKMLADFSEALTPTETPIGATTLKLTGRILLAEDSVVNQRLLSYYLRREGADVDVAGDGAAARDMALQAMFEGASYDLILMDMQMPKLDGYAASAQLRSKGYKGAIVALTAHAMATDRQKCLKSGCDDYLSKPATRAALIEMARRYLAGRQSAPVVAIAPQGVIHRMTPEGVDDDVIRDFLPEFLAELPEKVCRLQILLQESDHKGMAALLHSIKGSSGLYGFAKLMELAGQTEESVLHESSFASIQEQVRSLITMIRSIEGYDPQREALAHQTDWKVGPS